MSSDYCATDVPRPTHRLYVDEYGHDGMTTFTEDNDRYLSIVGVACELEHIERKVKPELEALKQRYFYSWNANNNVWRDPDEPIPPIVLHRSEMTIGKYPFGALRDQGIRSNFDTAFLSLLTNWEYTVFNVVMDKQTLLARYVIPQHPYHYGLEILLERYVGYLEARQATGDVLAEARGARKDRPLEQQYTSLYSEGTRSVSAPKLQQHLTTRSLKLREKKSNIAGLQIAEVVAQPCFRAAQCARSFEPLPTNFNGAIASLLEAKAKYYACPNTGAVAGFGSEWLP